jgi:dipeptidyl aminopeptidase/acylaminoacyl peptidase
MKRILILFASSISLIANAQSTLTPESLWKFGRVSDPRISPDGKTVLYNVKTYNVAENKGNADIYTIPTVGGNATALASGSANESAARWSADGKKIFFLMNDKDGMSQIFEMNPDGSAKKQVTFIKSDISNFGFAPAGGALWFTADVKVDQTMADIYPDLPKATGKVYDDLMYRHWTSWEDGAYSHVFVANYAEGKIIGTPIDIMKAERFDTPLAPNGGDEQLGWSPDGKTLAYTCKKFAGKEYAENTNSDIYLYSLTTNTTTNVSTGMMGYDINPRFSPDGKQLLWLSMETPKYEADRNRIIFYDLTTKTRVDATKSFDYSVGDADWSKDSKMIYFACSINATDQIWSLDLNPKNKMPIRQITSDIGDHQNFSYTTVGNETVFITSMMSISMPTELFKINLKDGKSTQLTEVNKAQLSATKMGRVEKRMIKATDGKDILTWVIYPPDFDPSKKYPALLYCQGGPQSTVSQFFSYRWNFQLMAAKGYIVVAPNRRGLPSFGTEWNRQISEDWGGQCMNDYLSAIDDVSKEPFVNKDRLGAVGASFGGYSVYWLAGHHNKRFKALISHCGVFDLKSMYGTTEELWFPDFDFGGPYWKSPQPASYQKFSPIDFVQNWDTPLLVIHNELDFRVPLGQGMEAFTAARGQNIPAKFLYFPDEGHWIIKPQNSILWQRVFFDWLDKYLKI